jgi:hypothetical protein
MIFTERYERTVDRDNTVSFYNVLMQLERAEWRPTLAGSKVIIHQHLDQTLTLMIAGHRVRSLQRGRKTVDAADQKQIKAVTHSLSTPGFQKSIIRTIRRGLNSLSGVDWCSI